MILYPVFYYIIYHYTIIYYDILSLFLDGLEDLGRCMSYIEAGALLLAIQVHNEDSNTWTPKVFKIMA